jgi:hypothetical protein
MVVEGIGSAVTVLVMGTGSTVAVVVDDTGFAVVRDWPPPQKQHAACSSA